MNAKLEFKAVFHLLDLARCYNLAKSSDEGYPDLTVSKEKGKDELKFFWRGEYTNIEWIDTLKNLGCTCKSNEFEFTLDSFTFYTILNNLRYKTIELRETKNNITIKYDTQSVNIKKILKKSIFSLKIHDQYEIDNETLREVEEQHSKIPSKKGITIFKDKYIVSEDSRFRSAICLTTLLIDVYRKECIIEKKKTDTVFSLNTEVFRVMVKLMKHGTDKIKVGFSKTVNGINKVRFSSNNISFVTSLISENRYNKLESIIDRATKLALNNTANFEERQLEDMLKMAQAPENDKTNLLVTFSNFVDKKICKIKTSSDAFNSTIDVKATCKFEFTVSALFLLNIYREIKNPITFKFDKNFPAIILQSETEQFILPCVKVSPYKYSIQ